MIAFTQLLGNLLNYLENQATIALSPYFDMLILIDSSQLTVEKEDLDIHGIKEGSCLVAMSLICNRELQLRSGSV